VQVGVGDVAVAPEAAFLVGCFAAAVLLGEVAAEFVLDVGIRVVAAVTRELRCFEAALVGEPPAVLVIVLGALVLQFLGESLVLLVGHIRASVRLPRRQQPGGTEHEARDVPEEAV